ncbi:MAG TPA: hypothetical protein VKG25_25880 [Bryobacteraceae bacterium]|nr:hypothetical protein [Bryobacteraceae bacterium]
MRLSVALALVCFCASAQIIDFESGGLHYKTLTKGGVTVMFAGLPKHVHDYSILQVIISNGSPVTWVVKPEDFSYQMEDGTVLPVSPALSVVTTLLSKGSRSDVIKLVTSYEAGVYGNIQMHTTNGYESRRQSALAETTVRIKAAAAASAIVLVKARLQPGESTDGAVFFAGNGKPLGPGTLIARLAGEEYRFPSDGEPAVVK